MVQWRLVFHRKSDGQRIVEEYEDEVEAIRACKNAKWEAENGREVISPVLEVKTGDKWELYRSCI